MNSCILSTVSATTRHLQKTKLFYRYYFSLIDQTERKTKTKAKPNDNKIISNKHDIMNKIRSNIRKSFKSPSTEIDEYYIGLVHTYPAWTGFFSLQGLQSHSAQNPYGHTLVEFFHFNGDKLITDRVMNIGTQAPFSSKDFINFFNSSDYFLNNSRENKDIRNLGNHQNGMLERSFITINIRVTKKVWDDMIQSYTDMQSMCKQERISFSLITHIFTNRFRFLFGLRESGNCTYWTTSVFRDHDMLLSQHSFPMVAFYKFLLNIVLKRTNYFSTIGYPAFSGRPKDYHWSTSNEYCITLYKGVKHEFLPKGSLLHPFYWIRNGYSKIWKVEKIADYVVELNDQCNDIKIQKRNTRKKNSKIIEYLKTIL
jgi:hypothetical protein